jgi:hypothetical protein
MYVRENVLDGGRPLVVAIDIVNDEDRSYSLLPPSRSAAAERASAWALASELLIDTFSASSGFWQAERRAVPERSRTETVRNNDFIGYNFFER